MGLFFIYSLKVGLCLIAFYLVYKLLLSKETFHTFNRLALLTVIAVSVLIPWNSCGMTQATVLKVATLDYLPYCFFNLLSPFMSIFIAAIGFKIVKKSK